MIFGETSKWVPMSGDRIQYISVDTAMNLDLVLQPTSVTENFNVTYSVNGSIHTRECSDDLSAKPTCRLYP